MTGIDGPYEPTRRRELEVDGPDLSVEQLVRRVSRYLDERGLARS